MSTEALENIYTLDLLGVLYYVPVGIDHYEGLCMTLCFPRGHRDTSQGQGKLNIQAAILQVSYGSVYTSCM